MIRRRAKTAGIHTKIGNHTFRATGITAYLRNGGRLEVAQQIAAHESSRTTGLYDRRGDDVSLDEVELIRTKYLFHSVHNLIHWSILRKPPCFFFVSRWREQVEVPFFLRLPLHFELGTKYCFSYASLGQIQCSLRAVIDANCADKRLSVP